MPIALRSLPVISTVVGGWLAVRAHRYLPLLLAVGAGLLLGTAFLDLLPEAVLMARSTGQPPKIVLATAWAAFLGFLVIESISDAIGRLQHRKTAIRKTLGRISGGPPNPSQLPRWHGDWRGLFRLQGGWAHSSLRHLGSRYRRRNEHRTAMHCR